MQAQGLPHHRRRLGRGGRAGECASSHGPTAIDGAEMPPRGHRRRFAGGALSAWILLRGGRSPVQGALRGAEGSRLKVPTWSAMVADGCRNTMQKHAQGALEGKNGPLGPTRPEIHGNLPARAPNMLSPCSCPRRLRAGDLNAPRTSFGPGWIQHKNLDHAVRVRIADPQKSPI